MHIRDHVVPRYLDRLLDEIPWGQFRAVGFTSTFQQSVASFALAARIRERHPEVTLIFGGANFDGEMGQELVKSIPVVDYAVVGEGDLAFPELLVALSEGGDPAAVPGVACRRGGAVVSPLPNPLFENLDDLPTPDYGEFFERAEALGLLPTGVRRDVYLPFESARGCWWGAKHHCTFCGLNNNGMAFRSKSPHRVREELSELSRRCRSFRFEAVDNILDTSYLSSLFTNLVEEGTDYEFFYEVKSNLTREHIRQLSAGGVRRIQPGIESLDSNVLRLMRKGVKAIQNVNTLRWAQHYGVRVGWNLLYGFPGETEEDYARQLALIRRLIHLEPPSGAGPIWMERFSPIFSDRESFPTHYVRPQIGYRYIFPRHVDLDSVAYFFDYEFTNALPSSAYEGTKQQVERWKDSWKRPTKPSLFFWSGSGFVIIEDLRDSEAPGSYTFEDPLASIYRACSDRPQTAEGVKAALNSPWPATEIESALDEFCKLGLMMREARSFLSLALPATRGR